MHDSEGVFEPLSRLGEEQVFRHIQSGLVCRARPIARVLLIAPEPRGETASCSVRDGSRTWTTAVFHGGLAATLEKDHITSRIACSDVLTAMTPADGNAAPSDALTLRFTGIGPQEQRLFCAVTVTRVRDWTLLFRYIDVAETDAHITESSETATALWAEIHAQFAGAAAP